MCTVPVSSKHIIKVCTVSTMNNVKCAKSIVIVHPPVIVPLVCIVKPN